MWLPGREHWTLRRFAGMCLRLFPWLLLHLPALGLAAAALLRGLRRWCRQDEIAERIGLTAALVARALVVAFYVGWLVQAVALQHLFDYVHAPGVLLAILTCVAVSAFALGAGLTRPRRNGRPQVSGVIETYRSPCMRGREPRAQPYVGRVRAMVSAARSV